MRIVEYCPFAGSRASGVTAALLQWSEHLAGSGHEVTVVFGGGDDLVDRYPAGVRAAPVRHLGRGRRTQVPIGLPAALVGADLLVLHEGWMPATLSAACLARVCHVPYVVMPHGVYEPAWVATLRRPARVRRALERSYLRHALAVHVFFDSEIADVRALCPNARPLVAATGVDPAAPAWVGNGGYLAWFGRYAVEHKGLDLALHALAAIEEPLRPRLLMRGVDYQEGRQAVEDLVRQLGVGAWVEVGGPVWGPAKDEFLRACDAYVHPSRWECHSIALLEALAMGVPMVVSDQIHVASTLRRHDAAIVTPLDAASLGSAMLRVRSEGPSLSDRARRTAVTEFSWREATDRFAVEVKALLA